MRQDAEVIMKLTDADNAADGIFFPALEQNMMGAVLINENDEVMFFNPAAEKLWGYKREEVIGNNIDMLIPRDLPLHTFFIFFSVKLIHDFFLLFRLKASAFDSSGKHTFFNLFMEHDVNDKHRNYGHYYICKLTSDLLCMCRREVQHRT